MPPLPKLGHGKLATRIAQCFYKIGRWSVLAYAGHDGTRAMAWCLCDCGTVRRMRWEPLSRKHSNSCGCLHHDIKTTHGHCKNNKETPEYRVWNAMLKRSGIGYKCSDSTIEDSYRGRGIFVCERWHSFINFYEDMGPRPSNKHSLDRIDNNNGYEPGNCRWATQKEQCRNTRVNRMLEYDGKTKCAAEWAEYAGISLALLLYRLKKGMSVKDALTRKVRYATAKAT